MNANKAKLQALFPLTLPTAILMLFTFGEVSSGDISGLSHLIQLAPVVIVALIAYYRPRIGSTLLIVSGISFGLFYLIKGPHELVTLTLVELLLSLPLIVSGLLLRRLLE